MPDEKLPEHEQNPSGIESHTSTTNSTSNDKTEPEVLKVSLNDLKSVERIFGLDFREQDQELLREGVNGYLDDYISSNNISIPNHIPPAFQFQPQIPNMDFSRSSFKPIFAQSRAYEVPENLEDLATWPILDIANLIYLEKLSCIDLTSMFLDRIKRYDPSINAVIQITEEYALKQAKLLDDEMRKNRYRGVLHGIPFGVKDIFAHPAYKTTWGSPPYQNQQIEETATVIRKLEGKGAIMVAKLSMGELAWGDTWFGGQTKTPRNKEFGSSGSSAGSGAAVAARMVPFAIGTETWGSIVSPSTKCGVTGLRPTFGRVSRHGAMALSWTMDKIGPMANSVEDCAVVFDAIRGADGKDLTVTDMPFNYSNNEDYRDLRVGYLVDEFAKDVENKEHNDQVLSQLKSLGVDLQETRLPDIDAKRIAFILSAEAATAFDELTRSGKLDDMVRQGKDTWPNMFRQARFIPAVEYIKANRIRFLLMEDMQRLFEKIDVFVAPPFGNNLLTTNLTGHPCVVVPTGYKENGLPTSITFTGGLYQEGQILRLAKAYQDSTKFHKQIPDLLI